MESIEKILPVVIFIIWTIISIAGKRKKQSAQPNAKPVQAVTPGGNRGTGFRPAITDVKKSPPGFSLLKQLKSGIKEITREIAESQGIAVPSHTAAKTIKPSAKPEPAARRPDETSYWEKSSLPPTVSAAVAHHASTAKHGRLSVNKATLRQAVIWSEIIGAPVSLRNQGQYD